MSDIGAAAAAAAATATQPAHTGWGSHSNLAKILGDAATNVSQEMRKNVTATLKIDGSNLGIEIMLVDGVWRVVAFHGRGTVFATSMDDAAKKHYGNGGTLGKLPASMFSFTKLLAKKLGVEHIIAYGEVLITKDYHGGSPSWHLFGHRVRGVSEDSEVGGWQLQRLTLNTHKLYAAISNEMGFSSELFSTPANLWSAYKTSTPNKPLIVPPPLMFSGSLGAMIENLFPVMMHQITTPGKKREDGLEGVFVVLEDESNSFKWKWGMFEEQLAIPSVDKLNIDEDDVNSPRLYAMVETGFKARPTIRAGAISSIEAKTAKTTASQIESELIRRVQDGINNIASKEVAINWSSISKDSRKDMLLRTFVPKVVVEVMSHYEDVGIPFPADKDTLVSRIMSQLVPKVMAIPFVAPSNNNDDE